MTVISIHQPGYLPWLGFFKKIKTSDIFVLLDDVQYEKKQWHNRNKIRTSNGTSWISVPVKAKFSNNINEIKIDNSLNWSQLHKKSISVNYSNAEYFKNYWNEFQLIYDNNYEYLIDLNVKFIKYFMKEFKIKSKTIFSSELNITQKGSDRILEICKTLNANEYISGVFGTDYLKLEDFSKNKIKVVFQNFIYPIYKQRFKPFIPNLSSLDLLLNEGENAAAIIKNASN